jgi:hypothetical protein
VCQFRGESAVALPGGAMIEDGSAADPSPVPSHDWGGVRGESAAPLPGGATSDDGMRIFSTSSTTAIGAAICRSAARTWINAGSRRRYVARMA